MGRAVGDPGQYSQDSRLPAVWPIKGETFCFVQTHFPHKELRRGWGKEPAMPALWAGRVSREGADSEAAVACPGSLQSLAQSKIN